MINDKLRNAIGIVDVAMRNAGLAGIDCEDMATIVRNDDETAAMLDDWADRCGVDVSLIRNALEPRE